MEWIAEWK